MWLDNKQSPHSGVYQQMHIISQFGLGVLIAGKMYSRVESRNSRVSIKTLNLARVRTFYQHDRSWIAGKGAKGRWTIAGRGWSPTLFPADAGTPSIDWHSRRWEDRNATKQLEEGATGGARPGKCNGQSASGWQAGELPTAAPTSDAAGQLVDVAGGMGKENGG